MLKMWSLSVRRRENDPPDHFLTLLHLELPCAHNLDAVLAHQPPHAAPLAVCVQTAAGQWLADTDAQLVQLLGHPWSSVASQAQAVLIADMGQEHHVAPLAMRRREMLPGMEAAF
jgi:hypothetical protein